MKKSAAYTWTFTVHKLKNFLGETDDLIQLKGYTEMEIKNSQAEKIREKFSDLISHLEELKIDPEITPRSVRKWKNDMKARYSTFTAPKNRQEETDKEKMIGDQIRTTVRRRT